MADELIPDSRNYTHEKCNTETAVSGDAFTAVSNPLADVTRTWCTNCNQFFPMSEYSWTDTGEKIVDYYSRHGAKATSIERFLCSKKFLVGSVVLGAILGIAGGYALTRNANLLNKLIVCGTVGFIGIFAAAALFISVITATITKRVCGVADTRTLK